MRIAAKVTAKFAVLSIVFGALSAPLVAQATEPDAVTMKFGERRAYFKDWLAACRPGGYCSALAYVGVSPDGQFADYIIRVEQTQAGADYGIIFIPVKIIPDKEPPLLIQVDDREIAVLEPGDDNGLTREPDDALNEYRFAQSRANLEILPAMKRGRFMTVLFKDNEGLPTAQTFSLRGLVAALAWFGTGRMN